MDFEAALRTRLLAAEAVTALAGDRVDWGEHDQRRQQQPDVLLQTIVAPRDQHMGGEQALRYAIVQVACSAGTSPDKVALREAVIAALLPAAEVETMRFRRGFIDAVRDRSSDRGEGRGFVHRDEIDFKFWFSGGD